jgi:hypothetical protein
MAHTPERRFFFAPSRDGSGWDLVEATKGADGWEVRRPGRIAGETLAQVPPPDSDWVEAHAPKRGPKAPDVKAPSRPPSAKPLSTHATPASKPAPRTLTRPAPKPRPPARKAVAPQAIPSLSHELEDLMLQAQRGQPVPKGMAQCPLCGVIVAPMRAKKVRTHDNPVTGSRCPASGKPFAGFGQPPA